MPDLDLMAEAYRRGILPEDKRPLFEEAVKRGLVKMPEQRDASVTVTPPSPAPVAPAPTPQTTVNPAVNQIIAAEEAKRGAPLSTPERIDMMATLNSQLGNRAAPAPAPAPQPQAPQAPQSGIGNFLTSAVSSVADPGANLMIRGLEATGLVSHERGAAARAVQPLPYDPTRLSGVLGSGVGQAAEAVATGPAAPALFMAQTGSQAIDTAEQKVASGADLSNTQAALNVAGQAAIAYAMGKLAPGQQVNQAIIKSVAPQLKNAVLDSVKNVLIATGVHVGEAEAQNLASNLVTKYTGVNPDQDLTEGAGDAAIQGGLMGGVGQGLHEVMSRRGGGVAEKAPAGENAPTDEAAVRPEDVAQPVDQVPPAGSQPVENAPEGKPVSAEEAVVKPPVDEVTSEGGYKTTEAPTSETERNLLTEKAAEPTKALTHSDEPIKYKDSAGNEQEGKYVSATMDGEHWVRDANGKLDKVPAANIEVIDKTLPRVPTAARDWSFTKLKGWADDNGYKVNKAQNLDAIRKAIAVQRQDSKIPDMPRPPKKLSRAGSFKKYKYWASQNGYDVSKVTNRLALKNEIKAQRKAGIKAATAKKSLVAPDERQQLRDELAKEKALRRTDELTGAPNLVAYKEDAAKMLEHADKNGQHTAIAESDIGNFKVVNDQLGHDVGDKLLQAHAEAIREELRQNPQKGRESDIPGNKGYRVGGDEFPAILRNADEGTAKKILKRVSDSFDKKAEKIIGDKLPKEAYPFVSWGVEMRKAGDTRPLEEIRKAAEQKVIPAKNEIKKARGIPETREGLTKFIEQHKASFANARKIVAGGKPLEGTEHKAHAPEAIEQLITPLISRIHDISPRVAGRLTKMEFEVGRRRETLKRELNDPAHRLTDSLGGKGSEKYQQFHLDVLNGDFEHAKSLLPASVHADFDRFASEAFPSLHKEMTDSGVDAGKINNYWPRYMKDYKAFDAVYGKDTGRFEEAWDLAKQIQGKKFLKPQEKVDIANHVLQGYGPVKPGAIGMPNARERSIEKITKDQLKYYVDPIEGAMRYVDAASYAAGRSRFLGKSSDWAKQAESVGKVIQEELSKEPKGISKDGQAKLVDLLNTRFAADMIMPDKWARGLKQVMYMTSLGQFRSSLNQVTDVAITAAQHGLANAAKGVKAALRLTPADQRYMMEEIGLHSHGEEFKDVGRIAKATDKILNVTGFKAFDRFGKESRINGAWENMKNAAKAPASETFKRLERDYKPALGDKEWAATVEDLKSGKKTDRVASLLFSDMMSVQPVTLSNMPEKYLKMKNGRIFYALKSFTLQQLDMVRRETMRKLVTPGQRSEGMKNLGRLALLTTLVGAGKDLLNDLIRGKTVTADQIPDRAVDGLLGLVGLNRYNFSQGYTKPSEAAMNLITPPLSWLDGIVQDLHPSKTKDGQEPKNEGIRSVRQIPIIGELLYYWAPFGRGFNMEQGKAKQEWTNKLSQLKEEADKAQAEGDYQTARTLISIYNERRKDGPSESIAQSVTGIAASSPTKPKPPLTPATISQSRQRVEMKKKEQARKAGG